MICFVCNSSRLRSAFPIILTCFAVVVGGKAQEKATLEFPLTVHVKEIRMETATEGVSGGQVTSDPNTGAVSGSGVQGGGTYTWHLMLAEIDGRTYGLRVPYKLSGKRKALAWGTMGFGIIGAKSTTHWLQIGNYRGRWLKGNGAVEVQYTDADGQAKVEQLNIVSVAPVNESGQSEVDHADQRSILNISSVPAGSDIMLDGSFVGQTPSTLPVSPGNHTVRIMKEGFRPWEKQIITSGGQITITADLQLAEK